MYSNGASGGGDGLPDPSSPFPVGPDTTPLDALPSPSFDSAPYFNAAHNCERAHVFRSSEEEARGVGGGGGYSRFDIAASLDC